MLEPGRPEIGNGGFRLLPLSETAALVPSLGCPTTQITWGGDWCCSPARRISSFGIAGCLYEAAFSLFFVVPLFRDLVMPWEFMARNGQARLSAQIFSGDSAKNTAKC
jgi:hypothetical protein